MGKGTALVIVIGGLGVLGAACGGSSNTPTPLTPPPTSTLAASSMSPNNNTSIPQNNRAAGCSLLPGADAERGLGIVIPFHWTVPASTSGIVGYELYVMKVGAALPLVDTFTTTADFTETECNAFVTDQNLQGWQWRTRSKDGQGQLGDWSPWASFEFSPCRLNDGTPCRAPE